MIKNVVSDIGGVGVLGAISISLFFVVFTGMLIRAWCFKRALARELEELPLLDGEIIVKAKGISHE